METPAVVSVPISALELSVRSLNALQLYKPDMTVEDLVRMTDEELLSVRHLGRRSVREIREVIDSLRAKRLDLTNEILLWAYDHQTLILSLMRGEAVVVPRKVGSRS